MPRGGMRFGAGRPGWHRKAEASLSLDVRRLARDGLLRPGSSFGWTWRDNYGEIVGRIGVSVPDACHVMLAYRWRPNGGESQSVRCHVPISRTPCNYGGSRVWFRCPGCDRRCALIYLGAPHGQYGCRLCARVAYTVQSEDRLGRLHRKHGKLERALAAGGDDWDWQRPKGMHRTTFDRLTDRLFEIEEAREMEIAYRVRRMLPGCDW